MPDQTTMACASQAGEGQQALLELGAGCGMADDPGGQRSTVRGQVAEGLQHLRGGGPAGGAAGLAGGQSARRPGPRGRDQLLPRLDEPRLSLVEAGRPWSFDGDGAMFRLVGEVQHIRLAHLFDPVLAVHTSLVDPLPHQITAVYEAMLPRQPLRFLFADDPGTGKTIMAGLLIRELIARGAALRGQPNSSHSQPVQVRN